MENTNVKREYSHYLITDVMLLYKLSDAGLLERMHKVLPSRHIQGARVWLFDKTPDVKAIYEKYVDTKHVENIEN